MAKKKKEQEVTKRNNKDFKKENNPEKKQRWYKQIWEVFKLTKQKYPLVGLYLGGVFAFGVILCVVLGLTVLRAMLIPLCFMGIMLGVLLVLLLLTQLAQRAGYSMIEGKEGASYGVLSQLRRGWKIFDQPIAVDPKSKSMVFRAIGKPGVVLVGEGSNIKAKALLIQAKTKTLRVIPNVPVHSFIMGNEQGQVPLKKLLKTIEKLPKKLNKTELLAVINRIDSMGGFEMGLPKGIDPSRFRPNRKALRGK